MKAYWLTPIVCCLAWLCAWPAAASDQAPPQAPLVVLERAAWVSVLARVDFLAQDRVNLDRQLAASLEELAALKAEVQTQTALIMEVEAQLATERKKEAVIEAERTRLQKELNRKDFWSGLKSYGLVGLGVVVAMLAIL